MTYLVDWCLVTDIDPWQAPEELLVGKFRLKGKVFDHPNFKDGSDVTTSSLVYLDLENLHEAATKNTLYGLRRPSEDWVKYLEEIGSPYHEAVLRRLK